MPLTFAHPAIILPLHRLSKRWFSLTGLVIGSVVPDFEYFMRMRVYSIYSHTWPGLFWFDLPVALLLAFLYQQIVRNTLLNNFPDFIKNRFSKFAEFNWILYFKQNYIIVTCSILIGAASHLFWDSFTHVNGYFVNLYHMAKPVSFIGIELPLYKLIQHVSTITGGIAIAITIFYMPHKMHRLNLKSTFYWPTISLIMLVLIGLRLLTGLSLTNYFELMLTAVSGFMLGLLTYPICLKIIEQPKKT